MATLCRAPISVVAAVLLLATAFASGAAHAHSSELESAFTDLVNHGVVADSVPEAERVSRGDEIWLVAAIRYTVAPGDTLFGISQEYGVSVSDIRRWNDLSGDSLRPGQTLVLYVRGGRGSRVRQEHEVRSGDTGMGIALRYGVRLDALRRWNPSADLDRLRIGQKLYVYVSGGASGPADAPGASTSSEPTAYGRPSGGRLINGIVLEDGPGYDVRSRTNAYGMPVSIDAIRYAYARLMAFFPDSPTVEVGDLSRETGGRFPPHRSHQNGLDADVAYFKLGETEHCEFESLTADVLDAERQWYLFQLWLEWGAIEYIFVDYDLQEELYRQAEEEGYTEAQLEQWFQWPRGRSSRRGIIRHEPGHDDHYHVRFVEGAQIVSGR